MQTEKIRNFVLNNKNLIYVLLAAVFLTVGILLVRAGGPFQAYESEGGLLSSGASVKSSTSASGGNYVEFTTLAQEPPQPSSGYGAGTSGAALAVPSGAISVTPSTIVNEINNRPGGTAFKLADGVYRLGQLPNKAGNRYYGNPNDHTKVVFDGETTYSSLTVANGDLSNSNATSGKFFVWQLTNDNVVANMTMRRYRGDNDNKGHGPLFGNGSNVLIQNVELKDNQFSGVRIGGSKWRVNYVTSRHNGQYGMSGGGSNTLVENSLLYANGLEGLQFVPRYERTDRGGTKFVFSKYLTFRNNEVHSHNDNGLWWDIGNEHMTAENNYIHDNRRHGIINELSFGPATIRGNRLINNAFGTQPQDYRDAGIFVNVGGPTLIENNVVDGARNGIVLYQPNRDITQGAPVCGSVVRNNTVKGKIPNSWLGVHSVATYDGCNPKNNPSQVTFSGNTEQGTNVRYWFNAFVSPSQWSNLGYN